MYKLIISGELPSLNEIIKAAKNGRGGYQPYNILKKEYMQLIQIECNRQIKGVKLNRIHLDINWYCKNKKLDPDNIAAGGVKILLDSMVHVGIIENDGWKQIEGFSHKFYVDKVDPRIEVLITEIEV
jgi:Holliday junction resolvase RusA-like endonuclease